jgi:hypothetical protein
MATLPPLTSVPPPCTICPDCLRHADRQPLLDRVADWIRACRPAHRRAILYSVAAGILGIIFLNCAFGPGGFVRAGAEGYALISLLFVWQLGNAFTWRALDALDTEEHE